MYARKVLIKALVSKMPQFICRAAFERRWANTESEGVGPVLILVLISNRMEIEHFVLHALRAAPLLCRLLIIQSPFENLQNMVRDNVWWPRYAV